MNSNNIMNFKDKKFIAYRMKKENYVRSSKYNISDGSTTQKLVLFLLLLQVAVC